MNEAIPKQNESEPYNIQSGLNIVDNLIIDQKYDETLEQINIVIQNVHLDKDYLEAHFIKCEILEELNQKEEALKEYDLVIAKDKTYQDVCYNKALCLFNLKRYEESIIAIDQNLEVHSQCVDSMVMKAANLKCLKRYEEAVQLNHIVLQIDSKNVEAFNNQSDALHKLGRYEDALKNCRMALQINPNFPQSKIGLAKQQFEQQNIQQSFEYANEALEYKKNDQELKELHEKLQNLMSNDSKDDLNQINMNQNQQEE